MAILPPVRWNELRLFRCYPHPVFGHFVSYLRINKFGSGESLGLFTPAGFRLSPE
jgi:hypothetical protein